MTKPKKGKRANGAKSSTSKLAKAVTGQKNAKRAAKDAERVQRRAAKLEHRKQDKRRLITADIWALPAPPDLVGKLDKPQNKSKYHSYFEFAENTDKKKKLEVQITNDARPPPGFKFVPIGDPTLTNACKELSRARDAMIFIVSGSKEEKSKIYEHMYRSGYHFREVIVDDALEIVGETAVANRVYNPYDVEPIPESQEEINKQADAAIRDLFPRIPNTDRQMVIDHAFKKGALFHGEPTVGLQPTIPLSRRVQLAVLAHIRHTHTRYDLLLRETTWINARKVVEPVCLDVLVKWRGDEETGRDQMEEILREVVIITDSEDSDDSSDEDSSEEEGEITSASSASISQPSSRNQRRSVQSESQVPALQPLAVPALPQEAPRNKKAQRGFKRYQAAWDEALTRQQENPRLFTASHAGTPVEGAIMRQSRSAVASPYHGTAQYSLPATSISTLSNPPYDAIRDHARYYNDPQSIVRQDPYYQPRPVPSTIFHRDEVIVRPLAERAYHQNVPHHGTPSYATRELEPSLVVRRSPKGLQDMLVPSIETASSDAVINSPDRRREEYGSQQESYSRRVVERRRQSPAPRQVIVINDESPQPKRRRAVYEDESGHFRPVPPHDRGFYASAPRADSHLPSAPRPRNFIAQRERIPPQSSQGLFREVQSARTDPVGEGIPIYDAPSGSGYFSSIPDRHRRAELGYRTIQQDNSPLNRQVDSAQPYFEDNSDGSYARRPINGDMRVVEHDRARQQPEFSSSNLVERPSSPAFPVSNRVSRPYEMGSSPVGYHTFLENFSQAQLNPPPLPRARDGFTVASSRQNSATQNNILQRYEDRPTGSFALRHTAPYLEGSLRIMEERPPPFYNIGHPTPEQYDTSDRPLPMREQYPPYPREGSSPTYVKTVRRPVIVLD